jgi:methylmalonyl-CoA mutase
MAEKNNLFEEFAKPTYKQWEDAFLKEVKAETIDNFIKEIAGIKHKPYYTAADKQTNMVIPKLNLSSNAWLSDFVIEINGNYKQANSDALYALERGVQSITFSGIINNYDNFCTLLKDILIQYIELNFENHFASEQIGLWYKTYAKEQSIDFATLQGSISCNPFKNLLLSGNWLNSQQTDFSSFGKNIYTPLQKIRTVSIDDYIFHYAGANHIEQSAIALSMAHYYLNELLKRGLDVDTACAQLQMNTCVSVDYFTEIARIRAIRFIWSKIIERYQPKHSCSRNIFIKAITSDFEWTHNDRESNIIRATTQAMSAAIAGCNAINIRAYSYDNDLRKHATRIAINIHHILREESFLDKVINTASGCFYIENYTLKIAEKIWELFTEIESNNSIAGFILSNKLSSILDNRKKIFKEKIQSGQKTIVGLNKYPPKTNTPNQLLPLANHPLSPHQIITPLTLFRLCELYHD